MVLTPRSWYSHGSITTKTTIMVLTPHSISKCDSNQCTYTHQPNTHLHTTTKQLQTDQGSVQHASQSVAGQHTGHQGAGCWSEQMASAAPSTAQGYHITDTAWPPVSHTNFCASHPKLHCGPHSAISWVDIKPVGKTCLFFQTANNWTKLNNTYNNSDTFSLWPRRVIYRGQYRGFPARMAHLKHDV